MSAEQRARRAEWDLEVVLSEAAERAKQAVEDGRELQPFAITLSGQNDIFCHEVSPDASEGPTTAVEILAYAVRAGAAPTTPRAIALARSVTVRNLLGVGATLAICVALEHSEGLAKRCFLPYSREGEVVAWQEPRSVPGVPWFFEARGGDDG